MYKSANLEDSEKMFLELKDLLLKNIYEILSNINNNLVKQFLIQSYDFELPEDVKNNPDLYLKPGDHVLIERKTRYYHHAIYIGNNVKGETKQIIHIYNPKITDENLKPDIKIDSSVRQDNWARLYESDVIKVCIRNVFFKIKCKKEIILTARKALNSEKGKYRLLSHNCHTFANYCVTDIVVDSEIKFRVDALMKKISETLQEISQAEVFKIILKEKKI
jgi:hypothetical protein